MKTVTKVIYIVFRQILTACYFLQRKQKQRSINKTFGKLSDFRELSSNYLQLHFLLIVWNNFETTCNQRDMYDVQECVLRVYFVNLKFEDHYSINESADMHIAIHIAIHRYVYHLMGVFCNRLKLYSTAASDCRTGTIKGRYRKQVLSFLLVSLLVIISKFTLCQQQLFPS